MEVHKEMRRHKHTWKYFYVRGRADKFQYPFQVWILAKKCKCEELMVALPEHFNFNNKVEWIEDKVQLLPITPAEIKTGMSAQASMKRHFYVPIDKSKIVFNAKDLLKTVKMSKKKDVIWFDERDMK